MNEQTTRINRSSGQSSSKHLCSTGLSVFSVPSAEALGSAPLVKSFPSCFLSPPPPSSQAVTAGSRPDAHQPAPLPVFLPCVCRTPAGRRWPPPHLPGLGSSLRLTCRPLHLRFTPPLVQGHLPTPNWVSCIFLFSLLVCSPWGLGLVFHVDCPGSHAHARTHTYTCAHTSTCAHTHVGSHARTHTHTHVSTHARACTHTHTPPPGQLPPAPSSSSPCSLSLTLEATGALQVTFNKPEEEAVPRPRLCRRWD